MKKEEIFIVSKEKITNLYCVGVHYDSNEYKVIGYGESKEEALEMALGNVIPLLNNYVKKVTKFLKDVSSEGTDFSPISYLDIKCGPETAYEPNGNLIKDRFSYVIKEDDGSFIGLSDF